jgi:hypothetical protein
MAKAMIVLKRVPLSDASTENKRAFMRNSNNLIRIFKEFSLAEGEELQITINMLVGAVDRVGDKNGMQLIILNIYKDYVVAVDWRTDKFYRFDFDRVGDDFEISDPIEVEQTFVPIEKSADSFTIVERVVKNNSDSFWGNLFK